MKIGIICALDTELAPFLPHIQNGRITQQAKLDFHQGEMGRHSVVAVFCGVGKTNATLATQILVSNYGVTAIINAGTAGGICHSVGLFHTVICTEVAHHDVNEEILTAFHPYLESGLFKADDRLMALLKQGVQALSHESETHYGRMVTGDQFITDNGRAEIIATHNPLSVDMETASIAHVCYVNDIPYVAIRTITDTAQDSGEDNFAKNCPKASEISANIVIEALR